MPERVEPCLALMACKPPAGDDWAFEEKWDGYPCAIHVEPGRVRVINTQRPCGSPAFPDIARNVRELGLDSPIWTEKTTGSSSSSWPAPRGLRASLPSAGMRRTDSAVGYEPSFVALGGLGSLLLAA
jgi:hypothetical protein